MFAFDRRTAAKLLRNVILSDNRKAVAVRGVDPYGGQYGDYGRLWRAMQTFAAHDATRCAPAPSLWTSQLCKTLPYSSG